VKQGGRIFLALVWLGVILFISSQPRIIIEPSKDLKDLQRYYQESELEIKGLDAVKEIVTQGAIKTLPAVDRFLGFYGTRSSDLGVKFDFVVRKAGHWTVYFILGLLIFNTLIMIPWGDFRISPYAWTLSIGMLTSIMDESHQTLFRGRSGTVQDLAVDTVGVIMALAIIFLLRNFRPASKRLISMAKSTKSILNRNGG
jgi:VanZ family protein